MTELAKDEIETKESSTKKYLRFIILIVLVVGTVLFWFYTFLIFIEKVSLKQSIIELSYHIYIFLSRTFGQNPKIDVNYTILTLFMSVTHILSLITLLVFHRFIRKKSFREIGIKSPRGERNNVILSIIGVFIFLYLAIGSHMKDFFLRDFRVLFFIEAILFSLIQPLAEEVFYRGIIQTEAMNIFGEGKGIIIASIIFMIVHVNPWMQPITQIRKLLFVFLYGVFWGYLYSKNRNLASPIAGHILTDAFSNMV